MPDTAAGRPPHGVIAVAGEALVDIVPAPAEGYWEFAPGGSPANVAVGLSRLDVPARMLARLADDLLGRKLRDHLAGNGVDLSHAVEAGEPSSLAIVELADDGQASYDFRISGTADWQWTTDELEGALDEGPGGPVLAVHSGSLALTTAPGHEALRELLASAVDTATVSYDPNFRPLLMGTPEEVLPGVHELLGLADVVKVSEEDLAWLHPGREPGDIVGEWLDLGPAVVVVTLGAEGVLAGTASGLHSVLPGRRIDVVDTVGAGDSFSAALLAGLHRRGLLGAIARDDLYRIGREALDGVLAEAVAAAAITCSRHGANPPTRAELDAADLAG
ncbi:MULTISPECIES: carbohydrate kinase [unclassified Pseudonocardia]|uniref:carbohydrate kinase family protein n=1 Tax=unclassified Pseudonocardia TaxID=2619320 RepID=UPI0007614750|nr:MULTISPECIES: carbohydrate kinase [unclassified Pseudonocardia]OLM17070.1 Fructokinase [Pseudonocardia sp. Ae707_Ps1]